MSLSLKSFRDIPDPRSQVIAKMSSDSRSQSQSRLRIKAGKIMESMQVLKTRTGSQSGGNSEGAGKFLPFTQNQIYNPGR